MKKTLSTVALLAAVLTLAGCGNSSGGSTGMSSSHSASSSHNKQDVTFAQQMIPHHQQAIVLAKMATTHAGSRAVKQLAGRIEAAQGPEIKTMTGWLKAWGQHKSSSSMPGMAGMGGMRGSISSMPGMMSKTGMAKLQHATGRRFDTMFLRGMITHHRGALQMASTEIANGKNPDAVALAKKIKTAQTLQIAEMKQMLNS